MHEKRGDTRDALVGREADTRAFTRLVFDTDVVVLTSNTGVGKTSLLNMGLKPALENEGFQVLLCNDWNATDSGVPGAASVDQIIARQLTDSLPPGILPPMADRGLVQQLDELYPDECVIILDQFEELIRYQRSLFKAMLPWAERTAAQSRVRLVISLRVEYEHELRGHSGLRLGPFQQARYELQPVTDLGAIREIINRGNSSPESAITDTAVNVLVREWETEPARDSETPVGLLHLQAALFTLWMRKEDDRIEDSDVESLAALARTHFGGLFRGALAESVNELLRACHDACAEAPAVKWEGIDAVLARRTEHYVRAMSNFLSSAGYKVSISRNDLAERVFAQDRTDELEKAIAKDADSDNLPDRIRSRIAAAVDGVVSESRDWLSDERRGLLGTLELVSDSESELPWIADQRDLTGGFLLGRPPLHALIEEYRAFHFALEWLLASELIRMTTPVAGTTMISLIHDLFGEGLLAWNRSDGRSPNSVSLEDALNQLTALRGARMQWTTKNDLTQLKDVSAIANVRWKFCDVTTKLDAVTFVNCDFQGTTFRDCTFSGVQFVNCTLDDVEFVECTILGSPTLMAPSNHFDRSDPRLGVQPSFLIAPDDVQAPDSLRSTLKSLDWYGNRSGNPTPDISLFSFTAGLAARPAVSTDRVRGLPFESHVGGLTMLGGRLSSLKVRHCTFAGGGLMSLRQVAGTSAEFADQSHLRLELFDTAVRGLTITRPIDAGDPVDDAFTVIVRRSALVNVWFGVDLRGTAVFDDCMVLEMFNAADPPGPEDAEGNRTPGFEVTLPESANLGVVNTVATDHDLDELERPEDAKRALGALRSIAREISSKIDYRRFPALFELQAAAVLGEPDSGEDA